MSVRNMVHVWRDRADWLRSYSNREVLPVEARERAKAFDEAANELEQMIAEQGGRLVVGFSSCPFCKGQLVCEASRADQGADTYHELKCTVCGAVGSVHAEWSRRTRTRKSSMSRRKPLVDRWLAEAATFEQPVPLAPAGSPLAAARQAKARAIRELADELWQSTVLVERWRRRADELMVRARRMPPAYPLHLALKVQARAYRTAAKEMERALFGDLRAREDEEE